MNQMSTDAHNELLIMMDTAVAYECPPTIDTLLLSQLLALAFTLSEMYRFLVQ